jgi:hypothetical protein
MLFLNRYNIGRYQRGIKCFVAGAQGIRTFTVQENRQGGSNRGKEAREGDVSKP